MEAIEPHDSSLAGPQTKTCRMCGETKPVEAFAKVDRGILGRRATCSACTKPQRAQTQRDYKARNIEAVRAASRAYGRVHRDAILVKKATYYEANADAKKADARARYHRNKLLLREKIMFRTARMRAQKKGVPFTITLADIVIPEVCPALGIPLALNEGRIGPNSATLDRIKPELGYVPGNIIVVSALANQIKSYATAEQVLAVGRFYANIERKKSGHPETASAE